MQPYQIFQSLDPELGGKMLQEVRDEDPGMFKTTLGSLAIQKKLRPVFLQRKSQEDQAAWVFKTVSTKNYDDVAEHLLQFWLLRSRNPMLCDFLDSLGIEHDGAGSTEEMPEEIEPEELRSAVDGLLLEYSATDVAIYLHLFQLQKEGGWPAISELLESDENLAIASPVVV